MSIFPLGERFWSKVNKTDGCWLWTANVNKSGYGLFSVMRSRSKLAHRLAYQNEHGPIPVGMHVCHSCDNPACVRPDHLWLGTDRDNLRDMIRKGRAWFQVHPESAAKGDANGSRLHPERLMRGESNHKSKLTAEAVREIRNAKRGWKAFAEKYGVSRQTIYRARDGEFWKHVI